MMAAISKASQVALITLCEDEDRPDLILKGGDLKADADELNDVVMLCQCWATQDCDLGDHGFILLIPEFTGGQPRITGL